MKIALVDIQQFNQVIQAGLHAMHLGGWMPLQVDDARTLQGLSLLESSAGLITTPTNVRFVVLPLVGAIVLFKNADASIDVMTREGVTGNVLWVHIGASRFACSYDHDSKSILMNVIQGDVVARFTNATSTASCGPLKGCAR